MSGRPCARAPAHERRKRCQQHAESQDAAAKVRPYRDGFFCRGHRMCLNLDACLETPCLFRVCGKAVWVKYAPPRAQGSVDDILASAWQDGVVGSRICDLTLQSSRRRRSPGSKTTEFTARAAMYAAAKHTGNVISQASTIRFRTIQRTSDMRRLAAAPTMAARNRVRRRKRNAESGCAEDRAACGGLRGKTLPRLQPRHARADRLDDAPATGRGSERHCQRADQDDPERNLEASR